MDRELKLKVALWRFGVLGPLVSARLEHGDTKRLIEEAAARVWERWDGEQVRVSPRAVEDWYYRFRSGGLSTLEPADRSDAGESRAIRPEVAELLLIAKRERPRRSLRRLIRLLERAGKVKPGELSRSSVHRLLAAHGISCRPRRQAATEQRAFRPALAGDLTMGDVLHGPKVIAPDGKERKSYLHLFLDGATRFVTGCAFRLGETAADLLAVFKQAVLGHGLPRRLYVDRGAAQTSTDLRLVCGELAIQLVHATAYRPSAKGAVEKVLRTIREEVIDELPAAPIELAALNALLWSWVSVEYHRRRHQGTGRVPLEHWLEQVEHLRPAPRRERLDRIFLCRAKRRVRKDSTVRFQGRLLEVRGELAGQTVELRFDPERPERLPEIFVNGDFVCDAAEVDLAYNSRRRRRPLDETRNDEPAPPESGLDPLGLIQAEHDRRLRPPAADDEDDHNESED
jgi:transposase InsO family protein